MKVISGQLWLKPFQLMDNSKVTGDFFRLGFREQDFGLLSALCFFLLLICGALFIVG